MSITSIIAAMTAAAAITLAPAAAADLSGDIASRSMTISYADLDLASVADQDTLNTRIRRAARSVCRMPAAGVAENRQVMICRTTATADALSQAAVVIADASSGARLAQAGGSLSVRAR